MPTPELERELQRIRGVRRWAMPLLWLVTLLLLPWTVWLTVSLPAHHVSDHWDMAWIGLDIAEVVALALTALGLWLRRPWLNVPAAAAGTLLLADAWFDVVLSTSDVWVAVAEAVLAEVPLAVLCFWIAIDVSRFEAGLLAVAHLAPPPVRRRWLHLAAARQRPPEGDLVRVLEVAADREAAREARDADASP